MNTSDLQIFDFQGAGIATTVVDGEPLLLLADACDVLAHSNPSVAKELVAPEDRRKISLRDVLPGRAALNTIAGANREAWFVTESGFYDLVLESRAPNARAVRRWVTREVLPAIRRTGMYATPEVNRELAAAVTGARVAIDAALETSTARARVRYRDGGRDVSDADREAECLETRALVDARQHLDVLARRFPVEGVVEMPATVAALARRARLKALPPVAEVDPWAAPRPPSCD